MNPTPSKGRPPKLSPEQIADANARLEKLRAIMAYFPELKPGTISQVAGLPINAFGQYLADPASSHYRQAQPDALTKLEAALAKYELIFTQNN